MPALDHATHEGLTFTESDIERRKQYVDLEPDDLARLAAVSDMVVNSTDEYVSGFFDYLHRFEETATLFAERRRAGTHDSSRDSPACPCLSSSIRVPSAAGCVTVINVEVTTTLGRTLM